MKTCSTAFFKKSLSYLLRLGAPTFMTQSTFSRSSRSTSLKISLLLLSLPLLLAGCVGGSEESFEKTSAALAVDVGIPCILEDEYHTDFGGFSKGEVILSTADECSVGLCLAHHFQGRVSCPDGQEEANGGCETPDGAEVSVPVEPQLAGRPADEAVVCSCRCDGDGPGPFCACPSGFSCEEVIEDLGSDDSLAGSYCVAD